MAGKSQREKQIGELIRQAEMARGSLHVTAVKLRKRLDVPARLRSSLRGHPGRWMAGSLFSGLAASMLLRRKPKRTIKTKGALLAILAMLTAAAKPLFKAWLLSQLKDWLTRSHYRAPASRPVPRPLP